MAGDVEVALSAAEEQLEELGALLFADGPDQAVWPVTAFSLAAHARSHHRALLHGLAGPTPSASQIHARPMVETAILIHYLAELPAVRVWIWIADGVNQQRKLLAEWLEAVERGDNDDATPEELRALVKRKTADRDKAQKEARREAATRDIELPTLELPSARAQAERDPKLLALYTQAFRHLSSAVHVASTLFTEDRYTEARSLLTDHLEANDRAAIRALAAGVLAVIYTEASRALGRDEIASRTEAVHATLVRRDA